MQGLKKVFDEAIQTVLNLELEVKLLVTQLEKSIKRHSDLGKLKKTVADFDVNQQSTNGSLLHVAAQANYPEAIRILLQSEEVDPNVKSWKEGSTPLMVACAAGNIKSVEALLECSKIDLWAKNKEGQTAEQIVKSMKTSRRRSRPLSIGPEEGVDEDTKKKMQTLIKEFRSKQGIADEEPIEVNASFLEDSINSLRKCTTAKKTGQSEVMTAAKRLKSISDQPDSIEAFIAKVKTDCPDLVEMVPDFAKALDALVHIPLDRFSNPKEVLTFTDALIESGIASQVERGLVFVLGNTNIGKTSLVNTFKNFVESPADEPTPVLTEEDDNLIETQVLEVYDGLSLKQNKTFEVKTSGNSPVLVKLEESIHSDLDRQGQGLQLRIVDLGTYKGKQSLSISSVD